MTLNHALNCIQLAASWDVQAVFLTGGEPTLHPGLLRCIDECSSLGLYSVVASNGSFKVDRLRDMRSAGLRELHVCYDKFHAPYIKSDRVKLIIDCAVDIGIRPVLIIIEANSYSKYLPVFGDHYSFCIPGETFKPIVRVGRAVDLPEAEFLSDTLLPVSKVHGFGLFVLPGGRVSFCPVNYSYASLVVDLAGNWLDAIVETFSCDSMVQTLLAEGVSGILRRYTGSTAPDWCSPYYECNLCIQATQAMRQGVTRASSHTGATSFHAGVREGVPATRVLLLPKLD